MTRTRSFATSLLSLSAAALLALTAAGGATAAPPAAGDTEHPSVTSAAVDGTGAADYWTAERMRNAIPGDVLAGKALARGNTSSGETVEKGPGVTVQGTKSKPALHQDEAPVSHIGKVFFTMGAYNYVCSGNAVASANKSTVTTAGHCVNEGPGDFVTNFVFIPAYENGTAPYGKWTAEALYAPTEWTAKGDMQYDTGFAVVGPVQGQYLSDVVGASGVAFNAPRGLTYKAFGYPAASPFTGRTLVSCYGTASDDKRNRQFNSQGIPCDMTGGSSGGPWFIQGSSSETSGSNGLQNSINSYGYSSGSAVMYGPYWGTVIQTTYNSAAAS
jgi:V8-like Glu-specific endopeptidase